MRFFMFKKDGETGLGRADGNVLRGLPLSRKNCPGDLDYLLASGLGFKSADRFLSEAPELAPSSISFLPPLMKPGKIICLGLNYKAHNEELKNQLSTYPELFARFQTTLIGHMQPVIKPRISDQLDYEGEMAVIIGKAGREISGEKAYEHVAAYSIFNDASVRDFQMRGRQWTPGKNFDSTGAFGPWLVSAEELPPGGKGLRLITRLNGLIRQNASTEDMIFDVAEQIRLVSQIMTLLPGDLIITGTPGGVGYGRDPKIFMKPGDECEVEIEGIGILRNPIEAQAEA